MKIAFDVDVLAKQMSITDMVHKVADWGYKYIEQSPHPRINPFYKHPLFSKECEEEYRKALKETGVEISSFICVYRWSGPTEEQRQHAVANWKKLIEIAVNMGVPVINTELSGDPNQQEICNGMWFRSMEELLPIIEREGLRVEIQSHPYDFCELNNETCDMVKSFRSKNLGYVYSSPHGFFYDQGKGDVRRDGNRPAARLPSSQDVDGEVDEGGNAHPAHGGEHGQHRLARPAQLAHRHLVLELDAHEQEEDRHQKVVHKKLYR